MFLLGVLVDAGAIVAGAVIGLMLPAIPTHTKNTIMHGLALAVILIGLGFALADQKDILIIIISLVVGGVIGEWLDIEGWLLRAGHYLEVRAKSWASGQMADAFVTASLIFCVGSLAVVGAIQSGMSGDNKTLYAKSLLDFFTSIVFATTMGIGVSFAAIPVVLYEGLIALAAYFAGAAINSPPIIACLTAVGGLLIVGIGFNLFEIRKIAVGNLLPALVVAVVIKWAQLYFPAHF
ncbi:DUF554 domain-containing protein [Alicyclobacillus sp. SO9]|uniref:DUF554 domain-containing protein n=1 Tax=Alicyclobacillus sp. SO9 TaxID=2665646 RepID=UPI0018E7561E|nr:DUF554 domain-containing protein [Alicyclobacillus sp. SO9]QQE78945.1 DUF554 domain-containing protein [Alicyclobacillus sp. SO9]